MKYCKLFARFCENSVIHALSFRFDFLMGFLEGLLFFVINYLFFGAFAAQASPLMQAERMVHISCHQIFTGLFFGLFIDNLSGLSHYINRGDLDYLLIKPVNSLFILSFRYINIGHITSALTALPLLFSSLRQLNCSVSASVLGMYLLSLLVSVVMGYSTLLIFMSLSLLFINIGGVYSLITTVIDFGKYPSQIFRGGLGVFFTVFFPIRLFSELSKEILIGQAGAARLSQGAGYMAVFLLASVLLFRWSIRQYRSSGS